MSLSDVQCQLLANYRDVTPVKTSAGVHACRLADQSLVLSGCNDDRTAYLARQLTGVDPTQDPSGSGWSVQSLGATPFRFAPLLFADGALAIHAFGITADGTLVYVKVAAGQPPSVAATLATGVVGDLASLTDSSGFTHVVWLTDLTISEVLLIPQGPAKAFTVSAPVVGTVPPVDPRVTNFEYSSIDGNLAIAADESGIQALVRYQCGYPGAVTNWYWSPMRRPLNGGWTAVPPQAGTMITDALGNVSPVVNANGRVAWYYASSSSSKAFIQNVGVACPTDQPIGITSIAIGGDAQGTHYPAGFLSTVASGTAVEMVYADFVQNSRGSNSAIYYARLDGATTQATLASDVLSVPFMTDPNASRLRQGTLGVFRDASALLHVLAINGDYHLCQMAQLSAGDTSWAPSLCLGFDAVSFTTLTSSAGFTDVIAVTMGGALVVYRYNTPTQGWSVEPVTMSFSAATPQSSRIPIQYMSYTAIVICRDGDGLPLPHCTCALTSTDPIAIRVNGVTQHFGAIGTPMQVTSDATGRLAFDIDAQGLYAPQLTLTSPHLEGGTPLVIAPHEPTRKQLAAATESSGNIPASLLNAKDSQGRYIVPDSYRAAPSSFAAFASALNQCVRLALPVTAVESPPHPLSAASISAVSPAEAPGGAIDFRALGADPGLSSWEFDNTGDAPRFSTLSQSDAGAVFASLSRVVGNPNADGIAAPGMGLGPVVLPGDPPPPPPPPPQPSGNTVLSASVIGDLIGSELGSAWDAIRSGAASLVYAVVQIGNVVDGVINSVRVGLQFLVDDVVFAFDGLLKQLAPALHLVESILTVIGIDIRAVLDWLALVVNWDEVLRTKHAISQVLSAGMDVVALAGPYVASRLAGGLLDLSTEAQAGLAYLKGKLGGSSLNDLVRLQPGGPMLTADNIVLTGVLNAITNGTVTQRADTASPLMGVDVLSTGVQTLSADASYARVTLFFESLTSVEALMAQALSALVDALAGAVAAITQAAVTAIAAVAAVLQAAVDQFKSLLTAEWDIPVVTDLYRYVAGGPLTLFDLAAFVVAIPVTATYKRFKNVAPFPDDASLTSFTSWCTAANLTAGQLAPGGTIRPPHPMMSAATEGDEGDGEQFDPRAYLLQITNVMLTLGSGVFDAACDSLPPSESNVQATWSESFLSKMSLACNVGALATACPWATDPNAPAPGMQGPDEMDGLSWIIDATSLQVDLYSYYRSAKKKSINGMTGRVTELCFGGMGFILAAYRMKMTDEELVDRLGNFMSTFVQMIKVTRADADAWSAETVVTVDAVCTAAAFGIGMYDIQRDAGA